MSVLSFRPRAIFDPWVIIFIVKTVYWECEVDGRLLVVNVEIELSCFNLFLLVLKDRSFSKPSCRSCFSICISPFFGFKFFF